MGIKSVFALVFLAALALSHVFAYSHGKKIERAVWVKQLAEATDKSMRAELERDLESSKVARLTREKAALEASQVRSETASSQERIRYVTRTVEVTVGCPVYLPDSVRNELSEGISKANSAKR